MARRILPLLAVVVSSAGAPPPAASSARRTVAPSSAKRTVAPSPARRTVSPASSSAKRTVPPAHSSALTAARESPLTAALSSLDFEEAQIERIARRGGGTISAPQVLDKLEQISKFLGAEKDLLDKKGADLEKRLKRSEEAGKEEVRAEERAKATKAEQEAEVEFEKYASARRERGE